MDVTGIGPYIKRTGAFKMMIQGTGFAERDAVTVTIRVGGAVVRELTGTVLRVVTGGCIARIGPRFTDEKDEFYDEDLAEVTVTVTNAAGTPDSIMEPGIQE